MTKERLTVSVDPSVAVAAAAAVVEGRAESVSAWVNEALVERAARDRRTAALAEAVAAWEAEHGVMTPEELASQAREDRDAAAAVRAQIAARRFGA
ncbi:MAG: hypothetical protein NVSMB4_17960 [Acidimicrobiales bacterium]